MLLLEIQSKECWDEEKEEFVYAKEQTLQLEHSLVSISKWESKWKKPFFSNKKDSGMTDEETIDYIRCMTITQNVPKEVYDTLSDSEIQKILDYIKDPMTATWFSKDREKGNGGEVVTSELVYYWMISLQIPFECQKWNFNRLMTLIKVCNEKNKPPKKMGRSEMARRQRAANASRRKAMHSKG